MWSENDWFGFLSEEESSHAGIKWLGSVPLKNKHSITPVRLFSKLFFRHP